MKNWGCICFDLDNTLLDYEQAFQDGMVNTYKHFFKAERVTAEEWFPIYKKYCDNLFSEVEKKKCTRLEYKRNRFIYAMDEIGIKVDAHLADEFQSYFYDHVDQFVTIFDGVEEILTELHQNGVTIGLITNGAQNIQSRKIERIGLDQYINSEHIFISDVCGCEKPNSEIFDIVKNQLCGEMEQTLHIGDSWELDVMGAIEAGWDAIYFNSRSKKPTSSHQPFAVCSTFAEVCNMIKQK